MPIPVVQATLAASAGRDHKRIAARRAVATEFFKQHLFAEEGDWNLVRRAMQSIDFAQPVSIGPHPPAPRRLATLASQSHLGPGFLVEQPQESAAAPEWFLIDPAASYLKWFAPYVSDDRQKGVGGKPGVARFFVPAARTPKGARLAAKEGPAR
jgi:hypothetical protein